jgi:hypothetical protein
VLEKPHWGRERRLFQSSVLGGFVDPAFDRILVFELAELGGDQFRGELRCRTLTYDLRTALRRREEEVHSPVPAGG